jgi:hypothetical protein
MSEEQIEAVDMLADRIEWLEEQIAAVELDNARLPTSWSPLHQSNGGVARPV